MKVSVTHHGLARWRERINGTDTVQDIREAINESAVLNETREYKELFNERLNCRILLVKERRERKRKRGKRNRGKFQSYGDRWCLKTVVRGKTTAFLKDDIDD